MFSRLAVAQRVSLGKCRVRPTAAVGWWDWGPENPDTGRPSMRIQVVYLVPTFSASIARESSPTQGMHGLFSASSALMPACGAAKTIGPASVRAACALEWATTAHTSASTHSTKGAAAESACSDYDVKPQSARASTAFATLAGACRLANSHRVSSVISLCSPQLDQ